jgi:hypothetical protein
MTSVGQLVEEAAAKAGPWPDDVPFVANLELLVASCRGLNATGEEVLHRAAVRHLRNLRYLQAYLAEHPYVAGRPLDGAVVISGLPRTGTTLLHNLLALDPGHRGLRFWEALHPLPPDAGGPAPEALQAQAERWLEAFRRLVPDFGAIHRATATGPEECDALLQNTFASQHFDDMFDAPEYSAWLAGAALGDEYAHYAVQLRVLAGAGARWALKSPSHLGHLDALLAVLPGATVVLVHRHPHQAVASYASLIRTLRRAYSDDVSSEAVGRQALERTATAMRRAREVCAGPLGAAVVDVSYDELVRDPVAVVRSVYAGCGRPLDAGVEAAVRAWAVAHPQHEHGPHRYDLAEFGLTGDQVDDAFGDYMERFAS